jgi:glycopeptide antibiotics resistance protein
MIVLGNVIMFIPFGFLGWIFPRLQILKYFFLLLFRQLHCGSTPVFYKNGIFEVDDIILNTFGVYIGWLMCRLMEKGLAIEFLSPFFCIKDSLFKISLKLFSSKVLKPLL